MNVRHVKILAVILLAIFALYGVYAAFPHRPQTRLMGTTANYQLTRQVTVLNVTTLIVYASSDASRAVIILVNNSTNTVWIGNSTVTKTSGFSLMPSGVPGSVLVMTKLTGFDMDSAIYGCTGADDATALVTVMEQYNP
jgi:hypothetical protein